VITSEFEKVEKVFKRFGQVKTFLVESDSTDKTLVELKKIQEQNNNFKFVSLNKLDTTIPNRYQRIAHCREEYLKYVKKYCQDTDYIVVVDLDGMNSNLSEKSVRQTFQKSELWDAVFANQLGRYYDIGALRHSLWSPNDCFKVMHWANSITSNETARLLAIQSRMIKINESAGLIPVDSAYGGLAIYRTETFVKGSYVGVDEFGDPQLDFVTFNLKLTGMGYRLVIDSQLINCVYNSHNASEVPIYDKLKSLSRFLPSKPFKRVIKTLILRLISKWS
jgi:hypothetical protein